MPPCQTNFSLRLVPLALVACAATPDEALRPAQRVVVVAHRAGDPIGGAPARGAALHLDLRTEDAFEVTAEILMLARKPELEGSPLSENISLIVSDIEDQPLGASQSVTPGSRIVSGEDAEELARQLRALPGTEAVSGGFYTAISLPSVTAEFAAVRDVPSGVVSGDGPPQRTAIQTWREEPGDKEVRVALQVAAVVEGVRDLGDESGPTVVITAQSETLVLRQRLVSGGTPLVIMAPTRLDLASGRYEALILQALAAPEGEDEVAALEERVAVARSEVRDSTLENARLREQLRIDEQLRLRRLRSIDALEAPETSRMAVVELAGSVRTGLASEIGVLADDRTLQEFVRRLRAGGDALRAVAGDLDALTWRVEREAILMLSAWLDEDRLPPEYEAILLRYAGEAGRYPGSLQEAIAAGESFDGFYARIREENRLALEDPSPAARVRSHDWLLQRGLEVPEYDPLGERSARRSAMRAWREAEYAAAQESEGSTVDPSGSPVAGEGGEE